MQGVNVVWLWWWVTLYGGSFTVLAAYLASVITSGALQMNRDGG